MIERYRLESNGDQNVLTVFIDVNDTEFSSELGQKPEKRAEFNVYIQKYIKEKFPNLKIHVIKVMSGSLLVSSIYMSGTRPALANTSTSTTTEVQHLFDMYTVKSGDSLSVIAKNHNVTLQSLKEVNQLKSDLIIVGQQLRLPFVSHTVKSGDSLFLIARNYNSTVNDIKAFNKLTGDTIIVGQLLRIPRTFDSVANITAPEPDAPPPPAPAEPSSEEPRSTTFNYTVVSGDSLSVIAKRFDTDVNTIRTTNNLTSDIIRIGQVLVIPQKATAEPEPTPEPTPEEPITTTFNYTVVSGDSLSVIAKRFDTDVNTIQTTNNLTSDIIRIGQVLVIPERQQEPAEPPKEEAQPPTKPIMEELAPINQANVSYYEVEGRTDPNTDVTLSMTDGDNVKTLTITSNDDGNFYTTMDLDDLDDGELTLSITAINADGKKSETIHNTMVKDTIIDIPAIDTADYVNAETQHAFPLNGTGKPGATVLISVTDEEGTERTTEARTDENGNYTTEIDLSSLTDSTLFFRVKQRDQVGNTSQFNLLYVEKIATIPSAPEIQHEDYVNNQNEALFQFTGTTEAKNTIFFTITSENGAKTETSGKADSTGRFTVPANLTDLEDGTLTMEWKQEDRAGNSSHMSTQTIIKNTATPPLALDPADTVFSGNVANYIFTGQSAADSKVTVTTTDGKTTITDTFHTDSAGIFTAPLDLRFFNEGELSLTVFATDWFGNKGEQQQISVEKDTLPPEGITLEDLGYVNNQNVTSYIIQGGGMEEGVSVTVRITDGVETLSESTQAANGTFLFNLDLSRFKDGPLTVELTQMDKAGNESSPSEMLIDKDTLIEEPVISKSGYAFVGDYLVYNVSGTAEPFSTIYLTFRDPLGQEPLVVTHTVNERGIFSIDVDLADFQNQNDVSVSITQSDVAGNISEAVAPITLSHIVISGDTLSQIAKRYNTTVAAIQRVNGITGAIIYVNQVLHLPVNAGETVNLGYLFFGDPKHFTNQVLATERSFNTVSPSYFDVNANGTLKVTAQFDPVFIQNMHAHGMRVVPFLSNHWDRELGRAMINNREQSAQQIVDFVVRNNLDGVNVDIENITHEDREDFTDFVRLLREKMPSSKEISVAVAANPNGWNQGLHGAYDYTELAKHADYLMMMTYDESYYGGDPGPVASLPWVERTIQYAMDQDVPKDKIVIGLAHYGRFWKEGSTVGGNGISNTQIQEMLRKYEHTVTFDESTQSVKAVVTIKANDPRTYIMGNPLATGTYTIWYENDDSYRAKVALVHKYGIKGVGHWSIGQENRDIWGSYHTWFGTKDSSDTPAIPPETTEDELSYSFYTVVSGDSLYRIALQHHTTIDAIKEANNITGDMIFVGQTLRIASS